ncbi:MAG: 4Fe-4S binding protein [Bacteroidales bacterium]|nr:4Fe-4S binding protein [Bacteroidales bacterium]
MKKLRVILAIVFFLGLTMLFTGLIPGLGKWLGWMPKLQFLPAVMAVSLGIVIGLILLTLVFGRIYCSTICPLGVMQDGVSHVSVLAKRARKNRKPFRFRKEHKWLRYGVWVLFVVFLLAGMQPVVALLAPYSAYGRIVSSVINHYDIHVMIVAGVTLLAVGLLAWFTGREYCNSICPVGTTLSFFSRFALFRPVIDSSKCKECGLCGLNCKASCIDTANQKIDYSRCVDCFNCIGVCNSGAIRYRFYKKATSSAEGVSSPRADHCVAPPISDGPLPLHPRADMASGEERPSAFPRRAFIAGAAMGLSAIALKAQKKTDGGFAEILPKQALDRETPLTPPGSKSVKDFYRRCTACQLCVQVCPNKVLRPSTDIQRLMQPEMGYENGYCRPECNECSKVCPSGAILPIEAEQKTVYHIGTASVNRELCVAEKGTKCGNCARHCPVGAIKMVKNDEGNRIPTVNEERCIGCGACENLCPSRPISAITVNGRHNHLEHQANG